MANQGEFNAPYLWMQNTEVVIRHAHGAHLNVSPMDQHKPGGHGQEGEFARWHVELEGPDIRLKSGKTGHYLRIANHHTIDVDGGHGPLTLFKVHRQHQPGWAMLESKAFPGHYIAVDQHKNVVIGKGGPHCHLGFFRHGGGGHVHVEHHHHHKERDGLHRQFEGKIVLFENVEWGYFLGMQQDDKVRGFKKLHLGHCRWRIVQREGRVAFENENMRKFLCGPEYGAVTAQPHTREWEDWELKWHNEKRGTFFVKNLGHGHHKHHSLMADEHGAISISHNELEWEQWRIIVLEG